MINANVIKFLVICSAHEICLEFQITAIWNRPNSQRTAITTMTVMATTAAMTNDVIWYLSMQKKIDTHSIQVQTPYFSLYYTFSQVVLILIVNEFTHLKFILICICNIRIRIHGVWPVVEILWNINDKWHFIKCAKTTKKTSNVQIN